MLTEREVRITVEVTALHVDALGDSSRVFFSANVWRRDCVTNQKKVSIGLRYNLFFKRDLKKL